MKYVEEKNFKEDGRDKIAIVTISISDSCKNGHEDFSATCSIGVKTRGRYVDPLYDSQGGKWKYESGGCDHESIMEHFPHLEVFTRLHLCDFAGNPIHAIANGQYHYDNNHDKGYHLGPLKNPKGLIEWFANANGNTYREKLHSTNLPMAWLGVAMEGVELLENLTGQKFKCRSTRMNGYYELPEYEGKVTQYFGFKA